MSGRTSRDQEPAARRRSAERAEAPDSRLPEADAVADAFVARAAGHPSRLPSALSAADGAAQARALARLQRVQGNAYVQRIVAEAGIGPQHGAGHLEAEHKAAGGAVVQRQAKSDEGGEEFRPEKQEEIALQEEAVEEARKGLADASVRECAGIRLLEKLRREPLDPLEEYARIKRRMEAIPRIFAERERLEGQARRGEISRAEQKSAMAKALTDAGFPEGYPLRSEEREMAIARCEWSRFWWEQTRRGRGGRLKR